MRAVINRAKSKGFSAAKLTVLSPQKDPFRLDTPTNRMNAKWFSDQVERFIPDGKIHGRGLHYKCNGNVFLPVAGNSQPLRYINSEDCWQFILIAAKAARWLQYVDPSRIFDKRNADAVIYVPEYSDSEVSLYHGSSISEFPQKEDVVPEFVCPIKGGKHARRKTPTGEQVLTMLEILKRKK